MSFYPDTLSNFSYYKKKIPLFYRDSYGFVDQFEMLFRRMLGESDNGIIYVGDQILFGYNIFDEKYKEYLSTLDPGGYSCDILEKVASLFGLTRKITVTYDDNGTSITETLTLTNEELLTITYAEIIKNNFLGTREECNQFYKLIALNVFSLDDETHRGRAKLVLAVTPERNYSSNIQKLFLAGRLTLASVGIEYTYSIDYFTSSNLIWDSTQQDEMWDFSNWS